MAFSSTGLRLLVDNSPNGSGPSVWFYGSSDAAGVVDATGYFAKMGYGSRYPSSLLNTTDMDGGLRAPAGLRVGDLMFVQENAAGATPYRLTMHSVTGATANQASTTASTGWAAGYDCSISST
jgi:hypothetical protein